MTSNNKVFKYIFFDAIEWKILSTYYKQGNFNPYNLLSLQQKFFDATCKFRGVKFGSFVIFICVID